jgi:hypothetical protein
MAENPASKDKSLEALDFLINVLKEHEQILDNSIHQLASITEQKGDSKELKGKIEKVDEKINNIQKEVTNLIGALQNLSKGTASTTISREEPSVQVTKLDVPSTFLQNDLCLALNCNQWKDFQALAIHSQTLFFSIKEGEKVFQVNAINGNKTILYSGVLPNPSIILKTWLSRQLGMADQNILEGSIEKIK